MENSRSSLLTSAIALGFSLGLGILIAGGTIGVALFKSRKSVRFVTVKGLAEKEVDANLVIWPLSFTAAANSLHALEHKIDEQRKVVVQFLKSAGFEESEINHTPLSVEDHYATRYVKKEDVTFRYTGSVVIKLRSNKVKVAKKTMEKTADLIRKGVVLAGSDWRTETQFLFTKLNDIKPQMIEEATLNARKVAEQFAKDSQSKIGKILHANQGVFQINSTPLPEQKKVRIVTTIKYSLLDSA